MDQAEAEQYLRRAMLAEDELSALRRAIREYREWLLSPDRGPVIYRRTVSDSLGDILTNG
jgi:hypothetical protein